MSPRDPHLNYRPLGADPKERNRARGEAADFVLTLGGRTLDLSRGTVIMGVLNVTPDSFSDGGRYLGTDEAVARARQMAADGAHVVDVGGESSRPGSRPVSATEELERVIPVIEAIRGRIDVPISIDTYKAEVAEQAIAAGAAMINDISALSFDPEMAPLAARLGVPVILMHIQGTPRNMQVDPHYDDPVAEVKASLESSIDRAVGAGVDPERIVIDPGIGFGKRVDDNLLLLKHLRDFYDLGRPVLVGVSRKAFIGEVTKRPVSDRLAGSIGAAAAAVMAGAHMVRVHDVAETRDAVAVVDAIRRGAAR
jgi:dihydropteroate synthase